MLSLPSGFAIFMRKGKNIEFGQLKGKGNTLIDQQEFYHGVVLVRLFDDPSMINIRRGDGGYIINDNNLVIIKYSTRNRSPWVFSFSDEEKHRIDQQASSFNNVVIALVCGGDGVCAIAKRELDEIGGERSGALSVRRPFRQRYSVSGPLSDLAHRIAYNRLNSLAFSKTF